MWTCWDRIDEYKDRKNNFQESFHNSLRVAAGRSDIGYHEMLSLLLKEHHKAEHNIAAHITDGIPQPKRNKNKMNVMKPFIDSILSVRIII